MIDDEFQPWLIEVNMNPCLETACNLLYRLIRQLIEQTLRIAVDPIFPPPMDWPKSKKYMLPEDAISKFELIFDSVD